MSPVKRRVLPPETVQSGNGGSARLLKIPEAAQYLNRSVWAVRDMLHKGILKPVGKRRPAMFDIRDLDKLIETKALLKKSNSQRFRD